MIYLILILFAVFFSTLPFVYRRVWPIGAYTVFGAAFGLLAGALGQSLFVFLVMVATGIFVDLFYGRIVIKPVAWRMKFSIFSAATPALLLLVLVQTSATTLG